MSDSGEINGTPGEPFRLFDALRLFDRAGDGPLVTVYAGDPEGNVTAPPGSLCFRIEADGYGGSLIYEKRSGHRATGWAPMFAAPDAVDLAAGVDSAGLLVKLDAGGTIDASMLDAGDLLHADLDGLGVEADHAWAALVSGARNITGPQVFESTVSLTSTAPAFYVNKATAGDTGDVEFQIAGSTRWRHRHGTAGELVVKRHDGAGAFVDNLWSANWTTGNFEVGNDIEVAGNAIVDGQAYFGDATDTVSSNAVTLDFDSGNMLEIDMEPATASVTATLSNTQSGGTYWLIVKEHDDGVGSPYPIAFTAAGATIRWPSGGQPRLTSPSEDTYTLYRFVRRGSNIFATLEMEE